MNRRTRPSERWACTRAPSSFHSTDAAPVAARAAATSADGLANIGNTGRLGCKVSASSASRPPVRATLAAISRSPAIIERASYRRDRHVGGRGDGGGHHTVERTLAQLAAEDTDQEPLLALGRSGEHRTQQIVAVAHRARTDERGEP